MSYYTNWPQWICSCSPQYVKREDPYGKSLYKGKLKQKRAQHLYTESKQGCGADTKGKIFQTRKKILVCSGSGKSTISEGAIVMLCSIKNYQNNQKNLLAVVELLYEEKKYHFTILVQTKAHKEYKIFEKDKNDLVFQVFAHRPNQLLHDSFVVGPRFC